MLIFICSAPVALPTGQLVVESETCSPPLGLDCLTFREARGSGVQQLYYFRDKEG